MNWSTRWKVPRWKQVTNARNRAAMRNSTLPVLGFRQREHPLLDIFDGQVQFIDDPLTDGLEISVPLHGQRQLRSRLDQHGPLLEQLPETFLFIIQGVCRGPLAVFMAQVTPQQLGIIDIGLGPGTHGLPVVMKLMAIEDVHLKARTHRQDEKRLVIPPCGL